VRYRTLENIAAFSEERANRSFFERARMKKSDAEKIKKWQKELKMAHERFSVGNHLLIRFLYVLMPISDTYNVGHRHSR
jgi:hypothetical protein